MREESLSKKRTVEYKEVCGIPVVWCVFYSWYCGTFETNVRRRGALGGIFLERCLLLASS